MAPNGDYAAELPHKRIRILHVSQPTVGGAAVCVRNLASAGVARGYHVTVASPASGDLPRWSREADATWIHLPLVRKPSPGDFATIQRVRSLVEQADIVHLHASKAGAVGRLALLTMRQRRRPPTVFVPHGWSWFVGGALAPAYKHFETLTASLADVIVAVSDDDRAVGARVLGGRASAIRVMPNGVDLAEFAPGGPRAERLEDPLIVCVGRLTRAKGQDLAIRSLGFLRDDRVRLRLVGEGETRGELERLAKEVGVFNRVEMPGASPDPASHLRAADVVVVPSRWDAQSLVLLEAMACGCAIVATRVPGVSAIQGGAGEIVESHDPRDLARSLESLLGNRVRRNELARTARRRVELEHGLPDSLERYVTLWRSLAPWPAARAHSVDEDDGQPPCGVAPIEAVIGPR